MRPRRVSLVLGLLGLSAAAASDSEHGLREGTLFAGHYQCGSPAWLLLNIEEVTESTINAIFHFVYPTSGQHGAFAMSGSFSAKEGRLLRLVGVQGACHPSRRP